MADGEPAIHALLAAVKLARREETVVTGKPRCDSSSMGLVESARQLVQGLLRTWVASMEKRNQTTLSPSSPLVQRSVRHCGWSLARYTILEDGFAPCRQLRERECGGAIAELAETPVPRARPEAEVSQEMGERTLDRHSVVDRRTHLGDAGRMAGGAHWDRPEHKRWSEALFAQVVCTPSEPKLSMLPAVQAQRKVYLT